MSYLFHLKFEHWVCPGYSKLFEVSRVMNKNEGLLSHPKLELWGQSFFIFYPNCALLFWILICLAALERKNMTPNMELLHSNFAKTCVPRRQPCHACC